MKVLCTLAALAAVALWSTSAFAQTESEEAPVAFTVIEADARLPFADNRVSGYQVARDDSLIIRAGPNRWYRATLWESCARELRWAYDRIWLEMRPGGALDRFTTVVVRGRRCPIQTLDRIERPGPETRY